ncbi:MAG: HAD-IA family hydrolase [Cyanosarcina radialis HA8281-LM2]|jgi:putative hydrolase of the HAD superfamily|nr:HAD-IA family hydrolase [Cyanosarcina radialis HA8281-LM2]
MKRPQVIFFDAVGTLFGVRGSVGQIYNEIARQFGVRAIPEELNRSFFQAFSSAGSLAFPDANPEEIARYEFEWWKAIASHAFQKIDLLDRFSDFDAFFEELYAHFATAKPWFVYSDVWRNLEKWERLGIELGVVSNFDSRIYSVLSALDLERFFTSITISSAVGFAKPHPQIFNTALLKHDCAPQAAWHIGDSKLEDYQGAKNVGIRPFLLKRNL